LSYIDLDRTVIGGVMPASKPLRLDCPEQLRADFFTQRREIGIMNVGDAGVITVDGTTYQMANRDALYIGRGAKDIELASKNAASPAKFYLISHPAHTEYPTTLSKYENAEPLHLGSMAESNKRTIFKHIHAAGIKSCQLVMGFTELAEGSVWNTMPAHKHMRRSEIYMYFNLGDNAVAFHFMGPPEETRHIVVRDGQAAISPGWSIHAGSGTRNYSFIWAMGGENQDYTDMDPVALHDLR
jgi:4-deoxy-L-threo-5-hexosulose-uronate ketol-isomerase